MTLPLHFFISPRCFLDEFLVILRILLTQRRPEFNTLDTQGFYTRENL